ncbi:tRNA-pseudouridine synthase [Ephemerocybe angulata]|uniref:tRNA-pseudouridine synthase n=1 Tax=Ephemerocybe angulata TaxID=980116 RepID=A0A8H6I974_9AGAR|nr:tRNA-pseudouridine synthase [Tulosesus angulatus]
MPPPLPKGSSANAAHILSQIARSSRTHKALLNLPAELQFQHNLTNWLRAMFQEQANNNVNNVLAQGNTENGSVRKRIVIPEVPAPKGLKKIAPYWYPYTTMTKMRWIGRELLEVVSTEFRDRSMEYYRYALESGVTTVNGQIASPTTRLRDGDRIENVVHRHEPPVTSTPVRVLHTDEEREFIVVEKPGSIPVHASGRYFRNTLIEILVNDFGYEKVYTVNRLDRLTSGLMIIPLTVASARLLTAEFTAGTVKKEYVARVKGKFPEGEIVCEEPLLTVDRQMGLNIVHPEGKHAKTVFNLIRYDANTDTSVVKCEPHTGRSHQLRVHLQFLGHPIANDPVYSEKRIWGENVGKNGIDTTPSDERAPPTAPEHLQSLTAKHGSPECLSKDVQNLSLSPSEDEPTNTNTTTDTPETIDAAPQVILNKSGKPKEWLKPKPTVPVPTATKLLPRETGDDIGMGSPVPLSAEAVGVITRLRNMKDEDEDWSRWRDVVFRTKGAMNPHSLVVTPPPLQRRRIRGNKAGFVNKPPGEEEQEQGASTEVSAEGSAEGSEAATTPAVEAAPQYTTEEIKEKIDALEPLPDVNTLTEPDAVRFCPECYLPLHPDPKPEKLYIFLHAKKYTTSLGAFETGMPEWAAEGWEWDRSE